MIKNKLFMLAVIVFSLVFILNCKNENIDNGKGKKSIPSGTNIAFRDDFDEGTIPNSFWTLCLPEHTNDNDPAWNRFFKITEGYECVRVEDGYLKLTAKKETGSWTNVDKKKGGTLHYKTGGVWSSKNKFGIGTSIKVRAKLYREGQDNNFYVASAFPAIWYYPLFTPNEWPSDGEIDIMEWVNTDKDSSYSTLHYNETNTGKPVYKTKGKTTKINVAEWHVYRCDWYSNNIIIYYDDVEVFKHTNSGMNYPYNENFYNIILNASLQKSWGTAVETDDSNLPYEMWVDWVEVSLIDKITGQPIK